MKKILMCTLLFVMTVHPVASRNAVRFTIAPLHRALTTAAADPYNVVPRLRAMLREQRGVEWLSADSVRMQIGDELTGRFFEEYEPVSLYQAGQKFKLDAVLCYQAEMKRDTLVVQLETISFPEGIAISRSRLALPQEKPVPQQNQLLRTCLQKLLTETIDKHQSFGFSFNDPDKGLVVLMNAPDDPVYTTTVVHFLSQVDLNGEEPVRVHISKFESGSIFNRQAAAIADERNAHFVLSLAGTPGNSGRLQPALYIRPKKLSLPVVSWTLPLAADYLPLQCDSLASDERSVSFLNSALFQNIQTAFTVLQRADLAQNHRSMIENHIPLWYAFGVRLGNALGDVPADSLMWLVEVYQQMIAVSKPVQQKAWLYLNLASLYLQCEKEDQALQSFQQADTLFTQVRQFQGAGLSRWHRAVLFSKQKNHPTSRMEYARAVKAFQAIPDSSSMADAMYKIAMLYELDQQLEQAKTVYQKTAELYGKLYRSYEAAQIYDHLGRMARGQSDSKGAMKQFSAYLSTAQEMHSEPAMARAHFQIALTYMGDQQMAPARENFSKAMDLFELLGDFRGMARTDINLGLISQQQGRSDEAKSHYLAALRNAEAGQDSSTTMLCNTSLAELAILSKAWDEVQNRYDQALATSQLLRNTKEQANILFAKGLAHIKEGRLVTGYLELEQAIALAGGTVSGDADKEQAFMKKVKALIGDIQSIKDPSNEP